VFEARDEVSLRVLNAYGSWLTKKSARDEEVFYRVRVHVVGRTIVVAKDYCSQV
jgi:hypothetical protein